MKKNLLKIVSMAVVAIALSACSKSDFFDDQNEAITGKQKADYATNFIKKYGEVDLNKSWDFTSMQPQYSLSSEVNSARAITRGDGSFTQTKTTGFIIEKTVLDWMFLNIPAGKNNSGKGNPFYMKVPQNSFTIVPVFQGNASYYWQLWMHVEGLENDIQIWAKGEDLGYRTEEGGELTYTGTEQAGVSKSAYEVEAPAITFSGLPTGANMYFYLKKWNSVSAYNNDAQKTQCTQLTSLNQKMLALNNCPKPTAVPEGNLVSIIGCEDATDNDYEDLVFMAYGIPPTIEPEEMYETFTKRYMLEDLGSTDDFDFNDVVVDVSEQMKTTFTYTYDSEGKKHLSSTVGPELVSQWAVVRAAGGTLDFTITIGSTTWTKSEHLTPVEQMMNTGWKGSSIDYSAVLNQFDIKKMDWDPANNNISVTVDGRGKNLGVQLIPFPKEGEIPMIIAVDKEVNWMVERHSVPDSWISND